MTDVKLQLIGSTAFTPLLHWGSVSYDQYRVCSFRLANMFCLNRWWQSFVIIIFHAAQVLAAETDVNFFRINFDFSNHSAQINSISSLYLTALVSKYCRERLRISELKLYWALSTYYTKFSRFMFCPEWVGRRPEMDFLFVGKLLFLW